MDQLRRVGRTGFPGLHYIPGGVAHRTWQIQEILYFLFAACWPSDAGHNCRNCDRGFAARLLSIKEASIDRSIKLWGNP